jgi:hypothetical protein
MREFVLRKLKITEYRTALNSVTILVTGGIRRPQLDLDILFYPLLCLDMKLSISIFESNFIAKFLKFVL